MKTIVRLVIVTVILAAVLIQGGLATETGGVGIFPADHVWNTPVDNLPVDSHSASYVTRIGTTSSLHPDFGSGLYAGAPMGIPFNIVDNSVTKTTVTFEYDDESDPGPYPIPANPLIEGGSTSEGDRHMLIIQRDEKVLYELYAAEKQPDGSWHAGSGAIYDLSGYDSGLQAGLRLMLQASRSFPASSVTMKWQTGKLPTQSGLQPPVRRRRMSGPAAIMRPVLRTLRTLQWDRGSG